MTPLFAFGPECCMLPPLQAAGLVYALLSGRDKPPADDADRPSNWPPHWPQPPAATHLPAASSPGHP